MCIRDSWEIPEESFSKPVIRKRSGRSGGGYRKDGYGGKPSNRGRYQGKMRSGVVISDK